jgi:hypothetical protein
VNDGLEFPCSGSQTPAEPDTEEGPMKLSQKLTDELKQLAGHTGPVVKTVSVSDSAAGIDVALDLTAVDSLSCSLAELRLRVPSLSNAGIDVLRTWASDFCKRITYLLEHIGPLEVDQANGKVLVRSTPPDRQDATTTFYEILLQSHANGNFTLRRYRTEKNPPSRSRVDIFVTHEVLSKLVNDLVDTIP